MELKHQLPEGKLYRCHLLAESKHEERGCLEEESLVIANNAEEARDKAEDYFKKENPGAKGILEVASETVSAII